MQKESALKKFCCRWGSDTWSAMFVLRLAVVGFFPLFVAIATELNHIQNIGALGSFMWNNPLIVLLDYLIVGAVFLLTSFLFRRTFLSMAVTGLVFFGLSWVEYFKYDASGTHFTLTDLQMTSNATDIAKFANLHLTGVLIGTFLLLVLYVAVGWLLKLENRIQLKFRMLSFCTTFAALCFFLVTPTMAAEVFSLFDVGGADTTNAFVADKQFQAMKFIPYFTQTAAGYLSGRVQRPREYGEDVVAGMMTGMSAPEQVEKKPNVIMIMSESYADFRKLSKLSVDKRLYQNFDRARDEGVGGTCVVPTFGGYTVRTEFELLTGLPVRSLGTPTAPQKLFDKERDNVSLARYYKGEGYYTSYFHPFSSSFYGRSQIYGTFGFDELVFEDDFAADSERYGANGYISDSALFSEIVDNLKENETPSMVFATSMQNHQPYTGSGTGDAEFAEYLSGVGQTDKALGELLDELSALDEPTIVLFVGDHFPLFTNENSTYSQAGIDDTNSAQLYEQQYAVWSNYGADLSAFTEGDVSAFYLPYLLIDAANLEQTSFVSSMLAKKEELPVYSPTYKNPIAFDSFLDILTYDRVCGKNYSGAKDNAA